MKRRFAIAGLTLFLTLGAIAATDVTGVWEGEMEGRNGEMRPLTMKLKQEPGGALTGAMVGRQGEREIQDGKVEGDSLSFKLAIDYQGSPVTLLYSGNVDGDAIDFTMTVDGFGYERQFTVKRKKD